MELLENTILRYEQDFFNADFCCKKENLENRICLDFFEYGKSGTIHGRENIINFLLNLQKNRDILISQFSATKLSENIIIEHYISYDKTEKQYALRTSIWKKEGNAWKIFFHQGTSCNCPS